MSVVRRLPLPSIAGAAKLVKSSTRRLVAQVETRAEFHQICATPLTIKGLWG
jgi:hypothetical protein